jgi:cytochrome c
MGAGMTSSSFPLRAVVAILSVLALPAPALAADKGESGFVQCAACHPAAAGQPHGVGPNLHGRFGQPIAGTPGFVFSRALRKRQGVWSEAELDRWLADPQAYAPGTKMAYAGMKDPDQRRAVIEYLKTLR